MRRCWEAPGRQVLQQDKLRRTIVFLHLTWQQGGEWIWEDLGLVSQQGSVRLWQDLTQSV